jgi:predicted DCC family thiol-disulfide oxidoreductase YuxK
MQSLFVIYDPACGLCSEIRAWLMYQPVYVPLRFVASGSPEALRRFPMLPPGDLAVISDAGDIWLDNKAWIVCLWGLREYRRWSYRFSRPSLLPMAQQIFTLLSRNRKLLSNLLSLRSDLDLRDQLQGVPLPTCQIKHR